MEQFKKIIIENLDSIFGISGLALFLLFFTLPLKVSLIVGSLVLTPLFLLMIVLKSRKALPKSNGFNIFKYLRNKRKNNKEESVNERA